MVSAYIAVFLLSSGIREANGGRLLSGSDGATAVLLAPVLIFSSLITGARERFSVRRGLPTPVYWIAYGLLVAVFLAQLALGIAGVSYPWWLNLVLPAATLVTMAAGPVRRLLSPKTPTSDRWENHPLSAPARRMTVVVGVMLGLLAATSTWRWFSIVSVAVMLLLLVVLIGWRSRWGLPRTGYEWGPIHWAAFGIAVTVLFLLVVLFSLTKWVTTPVSVSAGLVVFVLMLISAFLPAQANRG